MEPKNMVVNNVSTQQKLPDLWKNIHKGIMYSCIECEYRVRELGSVRDHMFITYDGKNFPCPDCDYQTDKRNSLKNTQRTFMREF